MEKIQSIRIAICDDHPVIRFGLATILDNETEFSVVLQAASTKELLNKFIESQPDITILDLELNGSSGIDGLRKIRQIKPNAKVIIYTAFTDNDLIMQAVELGIQGYLLKRSDCMDIIKGIRIVNDGGTSLEPDVATKLLSQIHSETKPDKLDLSRREIQVLALLAEGKTNQDIAVKLFICERTVKFHVSSILDKLQVRNRTEAALYARKYHILTTNKKTAA